MKPTQHVAVRLDEETIARVEALVPQVSRTQHEATRSDVLRMLVTDALARAEKDPKILEAMLTDSC